MQKIKSATHEIFRLKFLTKNGPGKTPKGKPVLERDIFILSGKL